MANTKIIKSQISKIDYAVKHDPTLIPTLFKDTSIKKGLLHNRLRKWIPHRFGVEFECFGDLLGYLNYTHHRECHSLKEYENYYQVKDLSQESSGNIRTKDISEIKKISNEIRISCNDYHQLKGFYRLLQLMAKCCEISPDCGIHIHVDLTKYESKEQFKKFVSYCTDRLEVIENIFPPYQGTYNNREIGYQHKSTYVNFSVKGTAEFRIAPLTFDYEQLIEWIINCEKFISHMIINCHAKIIHGNGVVSPSKSVIEISDVDRYSPPDLEIISNASSYSIIRQLHDSVYLLRNNTLYSCHNNQYYYDMDDFNSNYIGFV